jgi:hypothetical protein
MADRETAKNEFERIAAQEQPSLLGELYEFLKHNKKWWLLPILLMIGVFGVILLLSTTSVAPFIYTLF